MHCGRIIIGKHFWGLNRLRCIDFNRKYTFHMHYFEVLFAKLVKSALIVVYRCITHNNQLIPDRIGV